MILCFVGSLIWYMLWIAVSCCDIMTYIEDGREIMIFRWVCYVTLSLVISCLSSSIDWLRNVMPFGLNGLWHMSIIMHDELRMAWSLFRVRRQSNEEVRCSHKAYKKLLCDSIIELCYAHILEVGYDRYGYLVTSRVDSRRMSGSGRDIQCRRKLHKIRIL